MSTRRQSGNPFGIFVSIGVGIIILVGIYYAVKMVFYLLMLLIPIFLIGAFIKDKTVFTDHLKWIKRIFKKNPVNGLIASVLSVIGLPVLSVFLFAKALMRNKVKEFQTQMEGKVKGEYTKYEDVTVKETPTTNEEVKIVELPRLERRQKEQNTYDELFEDIDFEENSNS